MTGSSQVASAIRDNSANTGSARFGPQIFWFRDRPALTGCLSFTEYKQCAKDGWCFGYSRQDFHTMLVDLRATPEQLMAAFQSRTRSVVRKGERLGVEAEVEPDHRHFLEIYNKFAKRRGLAPLGPHHPLASPDRSIVTKAVLDGRVMVMRGYLVDREVGRVRNLVNCATEHSSDDRETPRLAGIAHRYLVYADMLRFGGDGYSTYDFGGYAVGTDDPKLANINRFKDSFGGRIVAEPNYRSWLLDAALSARALTRRFKIPGLAGGQLSP